MSENDPKSLLEAMPRIAEVVNKFKSEEVQKLAFQHLIGSTRCDPSDPRLNTENPRRRPATRPKKRSSEQSPSDGLEASPGKKVRKKGAVAPTFIKDLNLRPSKKKSLTQFVEEKKPANNQQLHVVIVYYLEKILRTSGISPSHVYTCLKELKERVPNDLWATLRVTANKTNGLNTGKRDDIKITVSGENLVDHDLPPKLKKGK